MNLVSRTLGGVGNFLSLQAFACPGDQPRKIFLRPGKILSVQSRAGNPLEILCCQGVLWITQEGNREDIVLKESQRVALRGKGRVVIQALAPATFSMTRSAEKALPRGFGMA
jgi:hypothetical protein